MSSTGAGCDASLAQVLRGAAAQLQRKELREMFDEQELADWDGEPDLYEKEDAEFEGKLGKVTAEVESYMNGMALHR